MKEQTRFDKDTELKKIIVEYVGNKLKPENEEVTVENVIEVMIDEFPEAVLILAEENFFRGYAQGLSDQAAFPNDITNNENN